MPSDTLRLPLALAALSTLSWGCRKPLNDVMDYYPKVVTESVEVRPDGTVEAVGRITAAGATDLVAAGFCVSTSPTPVMTDNQGIGTVSGDRFTVVYGNFSTTGTYYFRSWATNEDGYTYGNTVAVSDITPVPVEPPCTPTLDLVVLGGGLNNESYYPGQISSPSAQMGIWQVTANTSAHHFTYRFGTALGTRVYTTTTAMDPGPGQVSIGFISGFTSGTILAGAEVHVVQLTTAQWEVTVCQAPWGTGTRMLTTRFRINA